MDAFHAEGEGADAHGQPADRRAFLVGRAQAGFRHGREAAFGDRGRHLVVEEVDRAADRAAAIEQGGGAAQHLDPAQQQRLGGDGVIGGDRGSVLDLAAVGQGLDARRRLTANDRTAGAAAEIVEVDAGLPRQRIAQRRLAAMHEFIVGQGDHRGRGLVRRLIQGRRRHDDIPIGDAAGLLGEGGVGRQCRDRGGGQQQDTNFHDSPLFDLNWQPHKRRYNITQEGF